MDSAKAGAEPVLVTRQSRYRRNEVADLMLWGDSAVPPATRLKIAGGVLAWQGTCWIAITRGGFYQIFEQGAGLSIWIDSAPHLIFPRGLAPYLRAESLADDTEELEVALQEPPPSVGAEAPVPAVVPPDQQVRRKTVLTTAEQEAFLARLFQGLPDDGAA